MLERVKDERGIARKGAYISCVAFTLRVCLKGAAHGLSEKYAYVKAGSLHPLNPHQGRYDFAALVAACSTLEAYLRPNPKGDQTIDFSDEQAVRAHSVTRTSTAPKS